MNKAANTVKIIRIFESCKTYDQWNIAWKWLDDVCSEFYDEDVPYYIDQVFEVKQSNELTRLKFYE